MWYPREYGLGNVERWPSVYLKFSNDISMSIWGCGQVGRVHHLLFFHPTDRSLNDKIFQTGVESRAGRTYALLFFSIRLTRASFPHNNSIEAFYGLWMKRLRKLFTVGLTQLRYQLCSPIERLQGPKKYNSHTCNSGCVPWNTESLVSIFCTLIQVLWIYQA